MSEGALTIRDVHTAVHVARNQIASARALIRDDVLGVRCLDAAITILEALLRDLEHDGIPVIS